MLRVSTSHHDLFSRTLWKTSLSQLPAPEVPPDEIKPWIHRVFRRQHSRTPMSDAECGRKLYTDVLEHFRRDLVAGISQADPFERKAPEPAGGLSFHRSIYAILHILEVADLSRIQKLDVGYPWVQKLQTSYSETTPGSGVFRNYTPFLLNGIFTST